MLSKQAGPAVRDYEISAHEIGVIVSRTRTAR
jgi:hypothetical protein